MFCPKCGAKVDDDSKFCTECGASLGAATKIVAEVREQRESEAELDDGGLTADETASSPVCEPEVQAGDGSEVTTQPAPDSEAPQQISASKKKEPKALYVLGIAVGLVAIGILSWQLFFNKPGGESATFGQKSAIVCTVETKITPTDKDGKKIKSYTVELVGDNDYAAKAHVDGEDGFPLSTFGDAKAGKYTLKVTDKKSKIEYSTPVKIVKKGKAGSEVKSEVTVQVPNESKQSGSAKDEEDYSKNEISGKAKSVIQLGKMVAMGPADLANLLKDEGAVFSDGDSSPYMSSPNASWTIPFDASVAGIDKSIGLSNVGDQSNQPTKLVVGSMLSKGYEIYGKLDSYETDTMPSYLSQSDLEDDTSFDDVVLAGLPVAALDDASLLKLLKSCSLPSNGMQKFQFKESSTAVSWTSTTWTGIVKNGNKTHYWIVGQHQYEDANYPSSITVACVSEATASDIVERADLGLSDTWSGGSIEQKLDALAKSFTQDAGNGGMRTNVLSGKQEPIRNQ